MFEEAQHFADLTSEMTKVESSSGNDSEADQEGAKY